MSVDATITLDRLECVVEHDRSGGSEPYLWPIYIWTDEALQQQLLFLELQAASVANPSAPLAAHVIAGDRIVLPFPAFTRRLEGNGAGIGLAVVLLEADATPDDAMTVGRNTLVTLLREELRAFILEHLRPPTTGDEPEEDEITPIIDRIRPKVKDAIRDQLTVFQKLQNQDDLLGHAFLLHDIDADPSDDDFVLDITEGVPPRQHYRVTGHISVRPSQDPTPRCEAEREALERARANVEGLEATIVDLQDLLDELVGQAKAEVVATIRRLKTVMLPRARAAVAAAEARLDACLQRPAPVPEQGQPAGAPAPTG